ncbi:MAG: YfhO family protein [Blastocatellia bacterium]
MTASADFTHRTEQRERLIFAAALLLLPVIYFLPAVLGRTAFAHGDAWISNLGVRVLLGRMLAAGQLPLWNPYTFGGMPLLANVYTGALYPPNWLFAILSPSVALNVLMITSAQLALTGTYLFARRIGMTRLAALLAGLIFTFSGFFIGHLDHIHRLTAIVWLPWVLLAIEQLYLKAEWRWVVFGAAVIALQLFAGDPQMTLYTAMLGAAYAVFILLARDDGVQHWRFIVAGALMSLTGALLSLPQLLPELELMKQGERAQLSYEYFAGYSLPPSHLVSLIFPYFFGGAFLKPYSIPYWGAWNEIIPCGYVGLLGLLLMVVAWLSRERQSQVRFWTLVLLIAPALAFGGYLPFGMNRWLYELPVYHLFRGSYRHWFEFTFAAAMLAGFGVMKLREVKQARAAELAKGSIAILFLAVVAVLMLWLFGGALFKTGTERPAGVGSLASAEAYLPLMTFVGGALALWFYAARYRFSALLLTAILIIDLASFGWFFTWRAEPNRVNERLADPATVKFIKSREADLSSFRIISQSALPSDYGFEPKQNPDNHDLLNVSNSLIARGLQSVSGDDLFRLARVMQLAGDADAHGIMADWQPLEAQAQGLNLLNVKYLLLEKHRTLSPPDALKIAGVSFAKTPLHLMLAPGRKFQTEVENVPATELAIISLLSDSVQVPDSAPVARIRLHTKDGGIIERELQAGRDTSEWAWDRPDVKAAIKHHRAEIAESKPVQEQSGAYPAHTYLARLTFDRAVIERVEFEYVRTDAQLQVVRASLTDAQTGTVAPLDDVPLPPERWRRLAEFGDVKIYENLKPLPRAWFVSRLLTAPEAEILRAIKTGKLSDGQPFDPQQTAMLEAEKQYSSLPTVSAIKADAKITRYEPNRIDLATRNQQAGFLVLSEVFYPGWQARIDGRETEIHRTDYALRGVFVPAGEHRLEFVYRPRSFRLGLTDMLAGLLLLVCGSFFLKRLG